ncbi:MAG TPA: tetratricopeptide repeat protein [Rhodocyclaceae bacterium]|nr:tetratricopeptide repeat protein [Rhodocyclaceae bacterium]
MKIRFLPVLLAVLSFAAGAADDPKLPKQELTPQLLYQFLLAEIAGQRGQLGLSAEAYRDLAVTTRDPRIARRAAEVAFFARRYDTALEAARLWSQIEPDSAEPRYLIIALLVAANRPDELAAEVSKQLAAEGANLGNALLQLNRQLARLPDRQVALQVVNKVTAPYEGVAEAHFARAQAAHGAGDAATALTEVDKALALRPDWEYAALVRVQLMRGSEAVEWLGKFVAANPKAQEAHITYARMLVGERHYEEARREFGSLLAANPDNTDVIYAVAVLSMQLGDLAEAEKRLKQLVELNYQDVNIARIYLGQIAEEGKRWDDAIGWYKQVDGGEKYLVARLRAANIMATHGRLEEARQFLHDSAVNTPDERVQLLVGESQLLREVGRSEAAYQVLADGLAAEPDQVDLLYEAALAAEKVGKLDVLEKNLRRLIVLKPDYAHAYNALGYSFADRNMRLDEASQLIDKALQLAPEDPFILDSKGWVLYRQGDNAGAIDALKKALSIRPDPEIAAHLGEVLWVAGRHDEAQKTWNDAAKASPGNEVLVDTIKKFKP